MIEWLDGGNMRLVGRDALASVDVGFSGNALSDVAANLLEGVVGRLDREGNRLVVAERLLEEVVLVLVAGVLALAGAALVRAVLVAAVVSNGLR